MTGTKAKAGGGDGGGDGDGADAPAAGSKTLERALTVLLEVGDSGDRGLTLTECSAVLGYSKATTHRILRTLERRGFLRFDQDRGTFMLGVTNLRLGIDFLERIDLRREALPPLRRLAERVGETVHLGRLSGTDVVYIEKVESSQAVRMYSRVGDTMPAYSTGIGKAILAFLDERELQRHLPDQLVARTSHTIVDRDALCRELAETRERGYSIDDIENEEGIRCAGAPIFDHAGGVQAGISVAGPASRMSLERLAELGPLVREEADAISATVGHRVAS